MYKFNTGQFLFILQSFLSTPGACTFLSPYPSGQKNPAFSGSLSSNLNDILAKLRGVDIPIPIMFPINLDLIRATITPDIIIYSTGIPSVAGLITNSSGVKPLTDGGTVDACMVQVSKFLTLELGFMAVTLLYKVR